ncbi:hypothetical protein PG984_016216 [Apiospora sp. TS-2023a]
MSNKAWLTHYLLRRMAGLESEELMELEDNVRSLILSGDGRARTASFQTSLHCQIVGENQEPDLEQQDV